MFPPYVANLWHGGEMIPYQIRELEGKRVPLLKDLIIANTINSLIVFSICRLHTSWSFMEPVKMFY